jgi:DNA-binding LacI/PurR family transcriptional regulator
MVPSRRDLAAQFGVDLNTLQRAMTPLLSDGTLEAQNGRGTFVPVSRSVPVHASGSSIVQGARTRTIGVTAFFNDDLAARGQELPATHTILKAMEGEAEELEAKTTFMNRWRRDEEELSPAHCVRELLAQGADCVAVVDVYSHPYVLSELRAMPDLGSLPVVFISAIDHYVPCAHVYFDNRDAGYKAADMLVQAGHRQITFLSPYAGRWVDVRSEGARLACEIFPEPVQFRVLPGDSTISIYQPDANDLALAAVSNLMSAGVLQGGIVAAHDWLALELMALGQKQGRHAGSDYGLVGFDDIPLAYTNGLSTIRPPLESIGGEALRLALSCLNDGRWNRVTSLRAQAIKRNTHIMPVPQSDGSAVHE